MIKIQISVWNNLFYCFSFHGNLPVTWITETVICHEVLEGLEMIHCYFTMKLARRWNDVFLSWWRKLFVQLMVTVELEIFASKPAAWNAFELGRETFILDYVTTIIMSTYTVVFMWKRFSFQLWKCGRLLKAVVMAWRRLRYAVIFLHEN